MESYEKKYNKAQKWIESIYSELSHEQQIEAVAFFPELRESEDEYIRKRIIHALHGDVLDMEETTKAIAWLEKQDPKKLEEQFDKMIEADLSWLEKSTDDKIEPKFNIGDIIFNKKTKEQFAITDRSLALQYYHDEDHLHEVRFTEQDEWEIIKQKFKVGDWVIVSTTEEDKVVQIASVEYFEDGHPSYFTTEGRWFGNGTNARLFTDKDVETITLPESKVIVNQKPAEWSKEDEEYLNFVIAAMKILQVKCSENEIKKGTTNNSEYYYKTIQWLKSLKDRVQPQPKQEWSEKDTEILNGIANYLFTSTDVSNVEGSDEWYDWLKSLKNRVQKSF